MKFPWFTKTLFSFAFFLLFLNIYNTEARAANGKVILIDGINPISEATGSQFGPSGTGYLYSAIYPVDPNNPIDPTIASLRQSIVDQIGAMNSFSWSNSTDGTADAVNNLTNVLRSAYNETKANNEPLIIVSHSWGTVLAYIVLHNNPDIVVDKLITMGSPLNTFDLIIAPVTRSFLLGFTGSLSVQSLPNVRIWHNYWAVLDIVSNEIDLCANHEFDSISLDPLDCHSEYFTNLGMWSYVLTDVLNTPLPLSITVTSNYASVPADITFSAIGSLTSDGGASYAWDFGDGQSGNGQPVTHHYGQPGTYNVTLTVTDGSGGTHASTESVTVRPPEIDVSYPDGFDSLNRHFSTPSNSHATEYSWNYGDGSPNDTGRTQGHTFPTSGSYYVTLTLTLDDGSTVSNTQPVFVGPGTVYIQGHTIYYDETWSAGGTYVVQGGITVAPGATLTIEPGAEAQLSNGSTIYVNGTLTATGAKFTSANSQWTGIVFEGSGSSGSRLENCVIERTSGNNRNWSYGIDTIYIHLSSPTITGCTINQSTAYYGINVESGSPVINNNTISGMAKYGNSPAINIDSSSSPTITGNTITNNDIGINSNGGGAYSGNTLSGNTTAGISASGYGTYQNNTFTGNGYGLQISYGGSASGDPVVNGNTYSNNIKGDLHAQGTISSTVNWNETGDIVYGVGGLYISQGATLTIASGRTLKFDSGSYFYVYGTLKATNTKFTSADTQGQWTGIIFEGAGSSGSRLENCVIERTSGNNRNWSYGIDTIYIHLSSPTITGCTINQSTAYYGINVESGSPVINNNTISGMAKYGNSPAINIDSSSSPTITGNTITNNDIGINSNGGGAYSGNTLSGNTTAGISASGYGTYQNNTFTGNGYGLQISYGGSASGDPVVNGNTYSNNIKGDLHAQGTISSTVNWNETGDIVYGVGGLYISQGATLTIASGRTLKFDSGSYFYVYGTLKATNTKFTSADTQGQWTGIIFEGAGSSGSRLENCVIERTSGNNRNWSYGIDTIYIHLSSPTITGCTINQSTAYYGINVESGSPVINNNTISGMAKYGNSPAINIDSSSSPTITGNTITNNDIGINSNGGGAYSGNTLSGNTTAGISASGYGTYQNNTFTGNGYGLQISYGGSASGDPVVNGNTYSNNIKGDLHAQGTISSTVNWNETGDIVYGVGGLYISQGATLTIASGRTLKFDSGSYFYVYGTLKATNTKFTSADTQGQWTGIIFEGAGSSGSRLENCVIERTSGNNRNWGYGIDTIYIHLSSPTITGCTINQSTAYYEITVEGGSPVISNSTITGTPYYGIQTDLSSSPTVTGNTISGHAYGLFILGGGTYQGNTITGNTSYGLYYSGSTLIDATNNNWGDPSGPLDDSDDRSSGGLYNPTGLGNKVSDHVNYIPWTESTITATATPTGLAGEPDNQVVNLTWNANSEPSVGGYKIYYSTASGSYGAPITVGKVTSYTLTNLSNDTPYYIAISSVNSIGAESVKSAEITATPFYDSTKPTSSITIPANGAVLMGKTCTISGTASDTGTGVQKVDVSTDGVNWTQATGTNSWSFSWTLPQNGQYTIKSRATDKNNNVEDVGAGISVSVANVMATVTLDKPSYAGPMARATINVEDADADATAGPGNDTISVKVTSDTDAVGEVVTLNEDASIAGKFSDTFGFEPLKTFTSNGKVGVSKGDTLKVTYTDNYTPSGTPQDVVATATWDSGRAMWIRSADDIINDVGTSRSDLYDFCNAPHGNGDAKIDTLYIDGYDAINSSPTFLRSFIADAHSHSLRVECLAGAPEWATQAGKDTAEAAFDTITAFNDSGKDVERFDGIHLDVEPYLLTNWDSQTADVWAAYTGMLNACRTKVDAYNGSNLHDLTLAVDIPAWYDTAYPGITSSDTVQDITDYVVVRSLTDQTDLMGTMTKHELDYAKSMGKKALIGVETDCGTLLAENTFCEEGYTVMDLRLNSVSQSYQINKSFMGVAVNTYQGYNLLNQLPNSPVSTITDPANGATINGLAYTVTGKASSVVGVKKVAVSTDGTNWYDAKDTSGNSSWSTWSYNWTPLPLGDNVVKSRATDSMDNVETPGSSVNVKVVALKHLVASVNPSGCGSVTANPLSANGYYVVGTSVDLTAVPSIGYIFTGWLGDAIGTGNPVSVLMDTDKTVSANFNAKRYLTVSGTAGGSVSANPDHTTGYYIDGDTVTLTATPDKGYKFMGWSGSVSEASNPLTVTMDSNKAISASFGQQVLLLGYTQNGLTVALTATMYYNGSPAHGKTIKFYEQSGTGSFVSKGAATTNSNGIAIKTFTSSAGSHTTYAMFTTSGGIPTMQSDNVSYTIDKVILSSPANGSIVSTPTPTFSWQSYTGAATYHVQVATSNTFGAASLVINQDVSNASVVAPAMKPGMTYFWRVFAYTSNGKTLYSDIWKVVYKANTALTLEFTNLTGSTVTVKATLVNSDSGMPILGKTITFLENTNGGLFKSKGTAVTGSATSKNPGVATKSWITTVGSHSAYATFNGDGGYAPCASDPASVLYSR